MGRKRQKGSKSGPASKPSSGKGTPRRQYAPARSRNGPKFEAAAPSFSLADEARWASTHRSNAFTSDRKLRYLKIDFVSAGCLEGTIPEKPTKDTPSESPESPTGASAMANMAIRSPSPAPSNSTSTSSEDEVVFTGRSVHSTAPSTKHTVSVKENETARVAPAAPVGPSAAGDESAIEKSVTTETVTISTKTTLPPSVDIDDADDKPYSDEYVDEDQDEDSVLEDVFEKRLGGTSKWMTGTTPWESRSKPGIGWLPVEDRPDTDALIGGEEDPAAAAMDDYMQNIRDEIAGMADAAVPSTFTRRALDIDDEADDCRFEVSNTASDDGTSGDEGLSDLCAFSDDFDESDEEEEDKEEEEEEYDDARIARILQKQEELGLGSDDIVLFGGDEIFDDASDGPSPSERVDKPPGRRPRQSKGRAKRREPSFPSATAMADALDLDPYNGFDVMDTERPSLRPRKKGRRGQAPPELSDSDLNEQLQATWDADRAKKRLKKAEREELRKQGLLGRKGRAPDLSIKYQSGFDINDIIEEIREFMFSDMQTLSLPPMESGRRAVVHQMVNKLGINSRSRGSGAQRFTVLSKTLRTREVEDSYFDALVQKKGFRARFQAGTTRKVGKKATTVGVSYKDGEVVGASAPELGPENKGRALLEKMGWTKGTALGALDNKGILQPIAHTVKTGKAGLR